MEIYEKLTKRNSIKNNKNNKNNSEDKNIRSIIFVIYRFLFFLFISLTLTIFAFYANFSSSFGPYLRIASIIALWFSLTFLISNILYYKIKDENIKLALQLKNIFTYISMFFLILTILYYIGADPSLIIASGAFGGIIIGLGVQPILQNFFAGILILGTRIIEPGDEIRILTNNIPFSPASFPSYKVFSRDFTFIGYKGTVIEIGIFFTKILLDIGEELIIQNTVLLNGGIINYSKLKSDEFKDRKMKIRFEFDQKISPDKAITFAKKIAKKFGNFDVYIEEESDKNYYILCIDGYAKEGEYKFIKSEILKKLIKFNSEKLRQLESLNKNTKQ